MGFALLKITTPVVQPIRTASGLIFLYMAINKDSRTIAKQITLLKKRGMLMKDEQTAAFYLGHISYFRLKNYWWDMQTDKENHIFAPNSYFEDAIARYNFDSQLRLILFIFATNTQTQIPMFG